MNISKKITILNHKFSVQIRNITRVRGINSTLQDGKHILMWEFDEQEESIVVEGLKYVQARWGLPEVHLARSHPGGGYHAYSFKPVDFTRALHIISGTPYVDPAYIRMCCIRQHFTLRLTDKGQGAPAWIRTLPGYSEAIAKPADLVSYVEYETYARKRVTVSA